jgi:flagellar motor protein MotB
MTSFIMRLRSFDTSLVRAMPAKARDLYAFSLMAPRLLFPVASALVAAAALSSCVPALQYEEATSAAEVQAEAHRRVSLQLQAAEAKLRRLEMDLQAERARADARDQSLAQEKLERSQIVKERDDAALLLEQLRSDLARAGDSMRAYAEDNARLEKERAERQAQGSRAELAGLTQELERAISAARLESGVRLSERDGGVALRIEADAVFEPASTALRSGFGALLDAASSLTAARPKLSLRMRALESDAALPAALGRERRDRLNQALGNRGLSDRIEWQADEVKAAGAPKAYELSLLPPPAE